MFNDTIENNICLYNEYSQELIDKCVEESGLKKIIESLPDGIKTVISENGVNFSGGEKQRIAIARALIKNTPILILDEATSSLDKKTAYEIEKSILEMKYITAIIVSHKFSPEIMSLYDSIIVFKDNRVVEEGTFQDLMNLGGHFYSFYNLGG